MLRILFLVVAALSAASASAFTDDLARKDRDRPEDNDFFAPKESLASLDQLLTRNLALTLKNLNPKTDDPGVHDVTWAANGSQVLLTFKKQALGFPHTVKIGGNAELRDFSCGASWQRGYVVVLDTTDPKLSDTHSYVTAIELRICARESKDGLETHVQRVVDTGPEYQHWIGLLLGDFMRGYAKSLRQALCPK
jgi:hypothetical protein